jgi:hypothetical protein
VATAQLDLTGIEDLNRLHKLDHGGGAPTGGKSDPALTKAVDQLIEDTRWQASKDRADRESFAAANAALALGGRPPGFDPVGERQRELELQQRDLERIEQRAAERDAERASAPGAVWDASTGEYMSVSRDEPGQAPFALWTDSPIRDVDERKLEPLEPRITDESVAGVGDTFAAPVSAVEGADYRLTPPEAVPEAPAATGDTYRVRTSSVDTPVPTVPVERADSFSMPLLVREDSKPIAQEPPVPSTVETTGESLRLPTQFVTHNLVGTAKDGERIKLEDGDQR